MFQARSICIPGFTGLLGWHGHKNHTPNTPEGRHFGTFRMPMDSCVCIFVYQTWNFFCRLSEPEHAKVVFLTHYALEGIFRWSTRCFITMGSFTDSILLSCCQTGVSGGIYPVPTSIVCSAILAYRVIGRWVISRQLSTVV